VARREARATVDTAIAAAFGFNGKAVALDTDARDVIGAGCMVIREVVEDRLAAMRAPVSARRVR